MNSMSPGLQLGEAKLNTIVNFKVRKRNLCKRFCTLIFACLFFGEKKKMFSNFAMREMGNKVFRSKTQLQSYRIPARDCVTQSRAGIRLDCTWGTYGSIAILLFYIHAY